MFQWCLLFFMLFIFFDFFENFMYNWVVNFLYFVFSLMDKKKLEDIGKWKSTPLFKFLVFLVVLEVVIFCWIKVFTWLKSWQIVNHENKIARKTEILDQNESATWYKQILYIKDLEEKNSWMYRFERIQEISDIFDNLRSIWAEDSSFITLSEFNISLQEISLKWSVSTLKALYYTSPSWGFKSLLDRFKNLKFIKDMSIKTYERSSQDDNFEFVLHANVLSNDWE